jgi:hypothetical protein
VQRARYSDTRTIRLRRFSPRAGRSTQRAARSTPDHPGSKPRSALLIIVSKLSTFKSWRQDFRVSSICFIEVL